MIASITASLTVLSNSLVFIVMSAVLLSTTAQRFLKGEKGKAYAVTLAYIPSALLFLLIFYAHLRISAKFTETLQFPKQETEGWLKLFGFNTYKDLLATATALTQTKSSHTDTETQKRQPNKPYNKATTQYTSYGGPKAKDGMGNPLYPHRSKKSTEAGT